MKKFLIFAVFFITLLSGQKVSSYLLEADYYETSHNFRKAIKILKEGYRVEKNPVYLLKIAEDYLNLGEYRKAYSYAKKSLKKVNTPEAYTTLVRSLVGLGKNEFALVYLRKGLDKFPEDTEMIHFAANVYDALDSLNLAIDFYKKLLKNTDDLNSVIQLASALVRAGRYEEAESLLLKVEKELEEPDFRVEISLATIYEKKGEYEKSLVHYSKANLIQPSNLTIPLKMAVILMQMDSVDQALDIVEKLKSISPASTRIRRLLSLILEKKGDQTEALTERFVAYGLDPGNPDDEYYIARYLLNSGNLQEAERFLKDAVEKSRDPDILSLYAYLFLREKKLKEAGEVLYRCVDEFPDNSYLNSLTGFYFEEKGDLRLAKKYYGIALRNDSLNPKRYLDLATVAHRMKDTTFAIRVLERGISKFPENSDILFNLANLYGQTGHIREMEKIFRKLLEIDTSRRAVILNNWGYFLTIHTDRLNFADSLVKEALKVEPENPIFLDSKGWIEFRKGNMEEAFRFLQKAIEKGASDPEIFEHMGIILEKQGKVRDAIKWYKRALKADPERKHLKDRIKWLKKKL